MSAKPSNPASRFRKTGNFLRGLFATVSLALCGLLFPSCAIGPRYQRPDVNPPGSFRGESDAGTNSFGDVPWWQVFHDDHLQSLIYLARTNNYDIRIAATRVTQAREMLAEARAQFFPQLDYDATLGTGQNVAGNAPSPTGAHGAVSAAYATAGWEIDLWGRIRRLTESARAQYFASEEARRWVLISLESQVAQSYFQLLALDRELAIARESTNSYGESLKIFNEQLTGGIASKLETSAAEALLESSSATIPQLEEQVALQENQLSLLLGRNPDAIERVNSSLDESLPPEVPAGLPSALVDRRPDIRAAEDQLRSANAQVGVAEANFLPQLNLTGLFGGVGPELTAFTGGANVAWGAAAGLTGPLFHGGALRAQYRQAVAARDQAALQYQSTVLRAFQEVSNALVSRQKLAAARARQERAVAAYRKAVKVAMQRFKLGNASYYEVLQEQQLLFPAENTLVQYQVNQLVATVQLYLALGGGWNNPPPKTSK